MATARLNNRMGAMPTAHTEEADADDDGFVEQDDLDAEGEYAD
jgi:hypothetical protein